MGEHNGRLAVAVFLRLGRERRKITGQLVYHKRLGPRPIAVACTIASVSEDNHQYKTFCRVISLLPTAMVLLLFQITRH